jgi:hypothetical protein
MWGGSEAGRRIVADLLAELPDLSAAERARAETMLDGVDDVRFWKYFEWAASEHERAMMLMAWRTSFENLEEGRPCDLCPSKAAHVRFLCAP